MQADHPRRILVTAGPTWEPIDAVRFIGNRSSGRMGLSLAIEGQKLGHEVTLLLGRGATILKTDIPSSLAYEKFETVDDLEKLLDQHFPACDLLVMAAAVSDFRVQSNDLSGKMKREAYEKMTLTLTKTPDLVAALAKKKQDHQRVVAFALETPEGLLGNAELKLKNKQVDAIVGNPLKTMDNDAVEAFIWFKDHDQPEQLEPMSKGDFSRIFWEKIREIIKS